MLIAQQKIVEATFSLHHRHQHRILLYVCHFQPFVLLKLSKKFSWGPPFAKMPKMSPFSSLGNGRLRCLRSIVSGAEPLSLKCLIRTFIPSNFQVVTVTVFRSGIQIVAVKSNFLRPFWRANLGHKNAHSSTNNSHSHFSIALSSSAPHFTQNMSHSASCKNEAFQKIFMGFPLF